MVFVGWVILFTAMAEVTTDKNRARMTLWLKVAHVLTAISAVLAGGIGAWLAKDYGPGAAMYWAIVAGNTEPKVPDLPYPMGWFWFSLAVTLAGTAMLKGDRAWLATAIGLVSIGSAMLVLLPFFHIWRLVGAT